MDSHIPRCPSRVYSNVNGRSFQNNQFNWPFFLQSAQILFSGLFTNSLRVRALRSVVALFCRDIEVCSGWGERNGDGCCHSSTYLLTTTRLRDTTLARLSFRQQRWPQHVQKLVEKQSWPEEMTGLQNLAHQPEAKITRCIVTMVTELDFHTLYFRGSQCIHRSTSSSYIVQLHRRRIFTSYKVTNSIPYCSLIWSASE